MLDSPHTFVFEDNSQLSFCPSSCIRSILCSGGTFSGGPSVGHSSKISPSKSVGGAYTDSPQSCRTNAPFTHTTRWAFGELLVSSSGGFGHYVGMRTVFFTSIPQYTKITRKSLKSLKIIRKSLRISRYHSQYASRDELRGKSRIIRQWPVGQVVDV